MKSVFFILLSLLLVNCENEFIATEEWQEIPENAKVPAGLHYRINLETGKKEAKLLDPDSKDGTETAPVISEQNKNKDDTLRQISPERLKEMQEALEQMKLNKDVELIKDLMANYQNSSIEGKINILEDLDYLLHQIDNAQDFVSLGGMNQIILPSLKSIEESEEIVAKGAILLGSAAQANVKVQNAITKTEIPNLVLELIQDSKTSPKLLRRLIFALSALSRGNENSVKSLQVLGAYKILHQIATNHQDNLNIVLKCLSLISDLASGEQTQNVEILDDIWCKLVKQEEIFKSKDLDHIERIVEVLEVFVPKCEKEHLVQVGHIQKWLKRSRYQLWKEQDESSDFKSTIQSINKLLGTLKEEL